MAVLIPLACLTIAGLVCFLLARAGHGWAVWAVIVILAAAFFWIWALAVNATGWDGLGYFVVAFLMTLPALLGSAIGGGLGLWRRSRKRGRGADDRLA